MRAPLLLAILLSVSACSGSPALDGGQDAWRPDSDEDGDGITDGYEGRASGADFDGDGIPNYLDDDSDGDGISDRDEAGERVSPADTDQDGDPDFLDLDSDGNGVPDAEECCADLDGDGHPDSHDMDDDGDHLRWLDEPGDANGDGVVDDRDPDVDDDYILDGHEYSFMLGDDPDGDGVPSRLDEDSDGDGVLDREEAGDEDLATLPLDHDRDGLPDFVDVDSDDDGLLDSEERALGTSRIDADTDGDGTEDWIENDIGTDPLDPGSNTRTRGDVVILFDRWSHEPIPVEALVAVPLGASELAGPSTVHLAFTPDDPETAAFFGGLVARPDGAGCAARTVTTVAAPDDGLLAVEPGDVACWGLRAIRNESVEPIHFRRQFFRARLEVHVEGGPTRERFAYFVVEPAIMATPDP